MNNKLNNEIFIFRNLQLFYDYSDEIVFNDIIRKFIQNIFDKVFYSISIDDLEKLLQAHKDKKLYNDFYQSEQTKELIKRLYDTTQEIQKITNKNVDNFLNSGYIHNTFEEIVF